MVLPHNETFQAVDFITPSSVNIQEGLGAEMMIGEVEEEMIWEPEISTSQPLHYLAVDTNIFISHFNLFRTIHALLFGLKQSPLLLLIPSTVIYELDHLKASTDRPEPDSPITVGRLVRTATSWLLEVERTRREKKKGVLRCQSLRERYDPTIKERGSADDRILDCCLHFQETGGDVVLWTDDKNLSVKAETNHIPTIGGRHSSLYSILKGCGADLPEKLWRQVAELGEGELPEVEEGIDHLDGDVDMDMDMEINDDGNIEPYHDYHSHPGPVQLATSLLSYDEERKYPYLVPATEPALASLSPSPFSPSQEFLICSPSKIDSTTALTFASPTRSPILGSSPATPIPMSRSPSIINPSPSPLVSSRTTSPIKSIPTSTSTTPAQNSIPSRLLLTSLQLSFLPATRHLLALTRTRGLTESDTTSSIPTSNIMPTLIRSLTALDTMMISDGHLADSEQRITILRSIASIRLIKDFIEYHQELNMKSRGGKRRPRSGEVVDSLKVLVDSFSQSGVGGGVELKEMIEEVERLG
ncbi:hypothetical protein IAR55_001567 [Kwoniella newhampshirensis]|uniref:PIN domain-containing protein n=1 Tax=Kwoniella newhampshirensis TaxID=1651941 RepID=A0AAW0Z2I1_9TREE